MTILAKNFFFLLLKTDKGRGKNLKNKGAKIET